MVDIFDEVDEELRAERAQQLLKRYAGLIVAAALLMVARRGGLGGLALVAGQAGHGGRAALSRGDGAAPVARDRRHPQAVTGDFDMLARMAPEGYRTLARCRPPP